MDIGNQLRVIMVEPLTSSVEEEEGRIAELTDERRTDSPTAGSQRRIPPTSHLGTPPLP